MKRFKKSFIATMALTATFTLSACSSGKEMALKLDNGDQDYLTSDLMNVTNQEAFEAMATGLDSYGLNNAVSALIDLVDYDLLEGKYEIDYEEIDSYIDSYKEANEDFEGFLVQNGFDSEEELIRYFELNQLREAAARAEIDITEEDIQAYYDEVYVAADEDEDADAEMDADEDEDADAEEDADEETEVDEESEEAEEEEIPTLEEVRDEIEQTLINEQFTSTHYQTVLAKLRQEAGFEILDSYLQDQYVAYLEAYEVEDVFKSTKTTSTTVAAKLGDVEYTSEQLFAELNKLIGLTTAIELVDTTILEAKFEYNEDEINDYMDELKIQYADQFYTYMQYYGLNGDQEIFDYLKLSQLQEAAFVAEWTPTEERLKELFEDYIDKVSARHILVEDEETAKELIAQLEESEDVETLFAELAEEHSTDTGSAADGGDLGAFGHGEMISEFEEAAFALKNGEFTTEPVQSTYGYHIIYKYAEEKGEFEDVRDTIEQLELDNLYTSTRLEAALLTQREAVNLRFTDEKLQNRYEVVSKVIFDSLEEEANAE